MSFKITVEPSGHVFSVNDGETILDAALRHGLSFPYGCRNGGCGACKGKVVAGEVSYPAGQPGCLSDTEEAIGQVVVCQARPLGDVVLEVHEIGKSKDVPIRRYPTKVVQMEQLSEDVMRLCLKLPENDRMLFLAGQYIDIILPDGRRRSFSLANAPHNDEVLELHVRHVEGGEFTGYVFGQMKEKDIVQIEGPYGDFYLREESPRPMLFLAGGTGFAPIKGIIEHALQEGVSRPMTLYWGTRTAADQYLAGLVEDWQRQGGLSYVPVLSEAEAGDGGRHGFVHQAVVEDVADVGGYDVYVSGPPVMVAAAREAFMQRGLPKGQFYFDSFEFASDHQ
ncbi:MAG TPA: CDP-6-deoxy-delta-3,4-glucoseen reductase [Candidatus Tenderia sp.]|nr:CDP-6-deoxy-delta-3,4-glucoseen reductase [Candidatus Tenderia sp.]